LIIKEGDYGVSIYEAIKGQVGIFIQSGDMEVGVATLGQGEIFGEMVLFEETKGKRSASIVADGAVVIGTLDTLRLLHDWGTLPLKSKKLIQNLVKRLRESTNKVVSKIYTQSIENFTSAEGIN